jgi:integration host factor subunit beta
MNKLELIEKLKTEAGLTKNEATEVVNLFFNEMANALPYNGITEIKSVENNLIV